MAKKETITILGTGYVGLPLAALLAESGYTVFAIDPNKSRLQAVMEGRSFFYEAGLDPLVASAIKSKQLIPTDSYELAVPKSSFVFSCVGTPDNPDGSSNLEYVLAAAKESARYMPADAIYIQKSTVPVGTGDQINKLFGGKFSYVSNPEFLREGTAVADSLWPDRVVVGSNNPKSAEKVLALYRVINDHHQAIAKKAGVKPLSGMKAEEIITSQNSAELIKVASNAFLALKISFANSIAKLADQTDADVNEIMDGVGSDKRIGRAFFNAGRGYGGGCFPKDVSGLISSAQQYGVDLEIMRAVTEVNESMPGYIANKAKSVMGGLEKHQVTVLGLAFKAGTSDVRRSPGVRLANSLHRDGAKVKVFDPQANGEAEEELQRGIEICRSMEEALEDSDAVFVATDWPEFIGYNLSQLAKKMSGKLLIDCVNAYDPSKVRAAKLDYIGVGR